MYEITAISPWIPARYVGVVVAVLGLIPGVIGFISELNYLAGDEIVEGLGYLIVPLVIGLIAYVVTGVALVIYNQLTKQFGGLRVDLEFIQEAEDDKTERA